MATKDDAPEMHSGVRGRMISFDWNWHEPKGWLEPDS